MPQPADRQASAPTATPSSVIILVNQREVTLPGPEATGSQIKAAAGVPADFQLFRVRGERLDPVGDEEVVRIHHHERFRAVSGQDVS